VTFINTLGHFLVVSLGRPRRKGEDNIKMDLREMGIDVANWIRLNQDRFKWQAFVSTVMILQVP
jgi:hypothetical protein